MRKIDPDFNFVAFEKECEVLVNQMMSAYFKEDLEMLQKLTAEGALGLFTGILRLRKEKVKA